MFDWVSVVFGFASAVIWVISSFITNPIEHNASEAQDKAFKPIARFNAAAAISAAMP